jgi:exopolyphosphatase/guanosine-5'-triphosphate,3'-diphosphate pyrophosphatase
MPPWEVCLARRTNGRPLAAIDVGTNAVRLEIARPVAGGALETLHQERDPVRPGEGVFRSGSISEEVADRLVATLRRYAALCRRHNARVRAVATSALREARNGGEIVERARAEAGVDLKVISGQEEARLICLGVLHGRAPSSRALVIDLGGGSTEVVVAHGERPIELHSVPLGAVRLTETFSIRGQLPPERLALVRSYADEGFRHLPAGRMRSAFGSSGTIQAVVGFAAGGERRASFRQVQGAVNSLAAMGLDERRRQFDARRAEIIVAGAVVLEAAMRRLRLHHVTAVETGLRNGLLLDLLRRTGGAHADPPAIEGALALGRRFGFDEPHSIQVARLALSLFDQLERLHGLPATARELLEAAAILHDIGHAVANQRHHKHSHYLIANSDVVGLDDRERELVALIARFHRRSPPERGRSDLAHLSASDFRTVRRLAVLLRLADSLDHGHRQTVTGVGVSTRGGVARLRLRTRGPVDLETWDAEREAPLFRMTFGRRLEIVSP